MSVEGADVSLRGGRECPVPATVSSWHTQSSQQAHSSCLRAPLCFEEEFAVQDWLHTALQQWLLIYILGGLPFDIVDFFICELEDVIMEGLTVTIWSGITAKIYSAR